VTRIDILSDRLSSSSVARAQSWHPLKAGAVIGALRDDPSPRSPALNRPLRGHVHRFAALTFTLVLAGGFRRSGRYGWVINYCFRDAGWHRK
jgi:hypothetical protein